MHVSQLQYLPIDFPVYLLLVTALFALAVLFFVGLLRQVSRGLGIGASAALTLLLASLIGASINIPVVELPAQEVEIIRHVTFFGMRYVVPEVTDWPGTVIAVNVGGAIIPAILSLYLLTRNALWFPGVLAIAMVSLIVHAMAYPVRGLGIAVPILGPPIASTVVALLISRRSVGPLAYAGGSLGTLIGADLLNIGRIQSLGAPVASIGGAGTFDGIFVAGLLAVLFASVFSRVA
jgi:uncharacterized membrane protein